MDVFSTAQKEETLPSGWKEVSNINTMYISCYFFSTAGTDNCCFNLCGCYFLFGTQYAAGDDGRSALTGGLTGSHERQTSIFESNPLHQRDF